MMFNVCIHHTAEIQFLGINPRAPVTQIYKNTCVRLFIAALLVLANRQADCPSLGEWTEEMRCRKVWMILQQPEKQSRATH